MRLLIFSVMVSAVAIAASPALPQSQNVCAWTEGDLLPVDDLSATIGLARGVALKRGEFETTAQFEARKARAAVESTDFILSVLVDQENARYDADRERWIFDQYFMAGGNYNFDDDALLTAGLANAGWGRSLILSGSDDEQGTYVSSNAFGQQAVVRKLQARRIGIIEIAWGVPKPLDYRFTYGPIFALPLDVQIPVSGYATTLDAKAVEIPMPIAHAQANKGRFGFAVAGKLAEPMLIDHTHYITPTMDNPTDAQIDLTYLLADIQCGILTDGDGKVLKVLPMVSPF